MTDLAKELRGESRGYTSSVTLWLYQHFNISDLLSRQAIKATKQGHYYRAPDTTWKKIIINCGHNVAITCAIHGHKILSHGHKILIWGHEISISCAQYTNVLTLVEQVKFRICTILFSHQLLLFVSLLVCQFFWNTVYWVLCKAYRTTLPVHTAACAWKPQETTDNNTGHWMIKSGLSVWKGVTII